MKFKQIIQFIILSMVITVVGEFSGCNPCKVEILEKTTSPDGKWTATILTRDCGATTSEYMGVSLQDVKRKCLEPKNEVFVTKYIHRLHISWDGNANLVIDCENCSADDVKKKIEKLGPVQITYHGA